jgi:hypothetical protein
MQTERIGISGVIRTIPIQPDPLPSARLLAAFRHQIEQEIARQSKTIEELGGQIVLAQASAVDPEGQTRYLEGLRDMRIEFVYTLNRILGFLDATSPMIAPVDMRYKCLCREYPGRAPDFEEDSTLDKLIAQTRAFAVHRAQFDMDNDGFAGWLRNATAPIHGLNLVDLIDSLADYTDPSVPTMKEKLTAVRRNSE